MALGIERVQVWSGEMADLLGVAAGKLAHLAAAGVKLAYIGSGPHPTSRERGILYVAPITGAEQMQAARDVGLGPALDLAMLHIHGGTRPGVSVEVMSRLAVAGLYLCGMALASDSERFDAYLVFESADMAALAVQVLASLEC
jgi:hypothetical protein